MSTTPSILVVHHSADFDGIASREVARKALGDTAAYLGWDYGQDIPDLSSYSTVYLIDISLPPDVMAANVSKLVWIDHHASAIKANAAIHIPGRRIDGVAACRLAYQWWFGDRFAAKAEYVNRTVKEPLAIRLLGSYDVWDKYSPNVDRFQYGLSSLKQIDWNILLATTPGSVGTANQWVNMILERGQIVQEYNEVQNAEISNQRGFDLDWEGLHFRVLNTARASSLTFKDSIKPEHDGVMAYWWDGSAWKFSLYGVDHKKDVDLSQIAVKYGGGGHRGACGYELTTDQLPAALGGKL